MTMNQLTSIVCFRNSVGSRVSRFCIVLCIPLEAMGTKGRRSKDVEGLKRVFKQHAKYANFVQYREEREGNAKTELLVGNKCLIQDLAGVADNLSFLQSSTEAALKEVLAENIGTEGWCVPKHERKTWQVAMARRIRAMCRDVMKGRRRPTTAPWLGLLGMPKYEPVGGDDDDETTEDGAGEEGDQDVDDAEEEEEEEEEAAEETEDGTPAKKDQVVWSIPCSVC